MLSVDHASSNFTLFQALPTHVNFEVSITPSWVVEEWNRLESSHPLLSCSENLVFGKIFKLKTRLCSSNDYLGSLNVYSFSPMHYFACFHPTSKKLMWSLGRDKICSVLTLYISQIQGEKCHTPRSRCACVWNICG